MSEKPMAAMPVRVKYLRLTAEEYGLDYATAGSAGLDLRALPDAEAVTVAPGERYAFPSGIAIEPGGAGVAGFVFSRSGLGARDGLTVSQGVGVIDPDYRGEIVVWLTNTSKKEITVKRGDRVAQLIFLPFVRALTETVAELSDTARGAGGFGHTGKN